MMVVTFCCEPAFPSASLGERKDGKDFAKCPEKLQEKLPQSTEKEKLGPLAMTAKTRSN